MEKEKLNSLKKTAAQIRLDILEEVHAASSGHPGGSLSIAEIITYLYYVEMNVDPANPQWADRDRFVLSKGHTAPALYAALAEKGFFSRDELLSVLHSADLYVHTAIIEIEAIACLEAIVSGLVPVICNSERSATRFFALNELNLFNLKDVDELSMLIDFWYENPELKAEYAEKYKKLNAEFKQDRCMEKMEEMLFTAIETHRTK